MYRSMGVVKVGPLGKIEGEEIEKFAKLQYIVSGPAKSQSGEPYVLKDPNKLIERHEADVQHAQQQHRQLLGKDEGFFMVIGDPYPTCTTPLSQLQKMRVAEIKQETHRYGRYLMVRGVADWVYQKTDVITLIEDEEGAKDILKLTMGDQGLVGDLLPKGMTFAIKEPFYFLDVDSNEGMTIQLMIVVEHPSDVVLLDLIQPTMPPNNQEVWQTASPSKTALEFKGYTRSLALYTQALHAVDSEHPRLRCDSLRNRAIVNIRLSRFDAAKDDALSELLPAIATQDRELDGKAYLRASEAAYHLRQFSEAESHIQSLLKLCPDHPDGTRVTPNIRARLTEQAAGQYDFDKLARSLSSVRCRIDAADFVRRIESDLILCEKAFVVDFAKESLSPLVVKTDAQFVRPVRSNIKPWRDVVTKLACNPSLVQQITALHGADDGPNTPTLEVGGNTVIDTYRIHRIVSKNAFSLPDPASLQVTNEFGLSMGKDADPAMSGVWCHASYFNHSCVPNADRTFLGDLILVRATRDIAAGEEFTLPYVALQPYEQRRANIQGAWNFACDCPLCCAEGADSVAIREARGRLAEEGWSITESSEVRTMSGAAFSVLERQVKAKIGAIDSLYPAVRYNGLPKHALLNLQYWLATAYRG